MDNQVENLIEVWTNAGPVPWYHRMMQEELRTKWPMLAEALDNLVECHDQ